MNYYNSSAVYRRQELTLAASEPINITQLPNQLQIQEYVAERIHTIAALAFSPEQIAGLAKDRFTLGLTEKAILLYNPQGELAGTFLHNNSALQQNVGAALQETITTVNRLYRESVNRSTPTTSPNTLVEQAFQAQQTLTDKLLASQSKERALTQQLWDEKLALGAANNELAALRQQIRSVKDQEKAQGQRIEELSNTLREQEAAFHQTITDLETQTHSIMSAIRSQHQDLQQQLNSAREQMNTSATEHEAIDIAKKILETFGASPGIPWVEQLKKTLTDLSEQASTTTRLEQVNAALQQASEQANQRINLLLQQNGDLSIQLQALNALIDEESPPATRTTSPQSPGDSERSSSPSPLEKLRAHLMDSNEQRAQLKEQVETTQETLTELKKEHANTQQQLSSIQTQLEAKTKQEQNLSRQLQALTTQLNAANQANSSALDALRQNLPSADPNASLTTVAIQVNDQMQKLKQKVQQNETETERLRRILQARGDTSLEELITQAETKLSESARERQEQAEANTALRDELATTRTMLGQIEAALKEDDSNCSLADRVTALQRALEDKETLLTTLSEQRVEDSKALQVQHTTQKSLEQQLADLRQESEATTNTLTAISKALDPSDTPLADRVKTLATSFENNKKQLERLTVEHQELLEARATEQKALQEELAKATNALENQRVTLHADNHTLNENIAALQATCQDLEQKLALKAQEAEQKVQSSKTAQERAEKEKQALTEAIRAIYEQAIQLDPSTSAKRPSIANLSPHEISALTTTALTKILQRVPSSDEILAQEIVLATQAMILTQCTPEGTSLLNIQVSNIQDSKIRAMTNLKDLCNFVSLPKIKDKFDALKNHVERQQIPYQQATLDQRIETLIRSSHNALTFESLKHVYLTYVSNPQPNRNELLTKVKSAINEMHQDPNKALTNLCGYIPEILGLNLKDTTAGGSNVLISSLLTYAITQIHWLIQQPMDKSVRSAKVKTLLGGL